MAFLPTKRPYWDKPSFHEEPDLQHPQLCQCIAWYPLLEGINTNLRDIVRGYSATNYINPQYMSWRGTPAGQGLHFASNNLGRVDIINPLLTQLPTFSRWHVVIDHMPLGQYSNAVVASWNGTDDLNIYSINTSSNLTVFWRDVFSNAIVNVPDFAGERAVIAFGSASPTRHVLSLNGETVLERNQSNANAGPFTDVSFGNWGGSQQPFRGTLFQVRYYARFLEETELRDIFERPWAPFERTVLVPGTVVTGPVQLNIDPLTHVRPVDAVDVVEITIDLDIDGLVHVRPVDDPLLTPIRALFIPGQTHGRPVDDILITATEEAAPETLTHARSVDQVDVTQLVGILLDVDSLDHIHPVDPLLLDVEALVTIDGLDHTHPLDLVDIQPLLGDQTGMGATGSAWVLDAGQALTNASGLDLSYHVLEGVFDGSSSVLGVDGSRVTGAAGMRELTTLTVGADVDGNRRTEGEIAELRVYAGALTLSQRDAILAELRQKWITG